MRVAAVLLEVRRRLNMNTQSLSMAILCLSFAGFCSGCYSARLQFKSSDANMILGYNPRYTVVSAPIRFDAEGNANRTIKISGLPSGYGFVRMQYPRDLADALPAGSSARFRLKVSAPSNPETDRFVLEETYEPILLRRGYSILDDGRDWKYWGLWDNFVIMPPDDWSDSDAGRVINLYRQDIVYTEGPASAAVWRRTRDSHTASDRIGIVFDPHRVFEFSVSLEGADEVLNPEQYDIYLAITSGHRK